MKKILSLTLALMGIVSFTTMGQTGTDKNIALQTKLGFADAVQTQGKGNWQLNFSTDFLKEVRQYVYWSEGSYSNNFASVNQQLTYGLIDRLDVYGGVGFTHHRLIINKEFVDGSGRDYLNFVGGLRFHLIKQNGGLPNILLSTDVFQGPSVSVYQANFRAHLLWHYALGNNWNIRGHFGIAKPEFSYVSLFMYTNVNVMCQINKDLGVFVGGDIKGMEGNLDYFEGEVQAGVNWSLNDRLLLSGVYSYTPSNYFNIYHDAYNGQLKASFAF